MAVLKGKDRVSENQRPWHNSHFYSVTPATPELLQLLPSSAANWKKMAVLQGKDRFRKISARGMIRIFHSVTPATPELL
ncbi:MAG: hypothetical protein QOE88_768 [Verrucomicrobiota bacterium]|nr:hypothetical protein [Verrucomicrobiota bacterium]